MNLREEIKEIIDGGVSCDDDYPYFIGDPIDEIIKVIEKRIDSRIKEINIEFENEFGWIEKQGADMWMECKTDDIVYHEELQAKKSILEEIKQEMLK